jgi:glycosyltransferase involved in cell wall biosynthesis
MSAYPGKVGIQQRVLTTYRAVFFDALAGECTGGLSVCAGQPLPEESITVAPGLQAARFQPLHNLHLLRGALLLCHQRGLLDWLKTWDPDILIAEANPRDISTPAAARWMHRRGRPVLGWGLGAPAPASIPAAVRGAGERMTRAVLRRSLRQFDALLTYSRRGAQEYAALGFPAERIFIAPNAAVRRPSQAAPVRQPAFNGRANLLFVGRLQERKRIDTLLHACASLPEALQPRLVIVGEGPARPALETLARSLYPRAEFHGARHGADLEHFFDEADLFVLPGTGGLAVQEAMAHALPVVMGQGDGTNDDLVRAENGWQVPDPAALPGVLLEALSDPARLRRMGAASHRIVSGEVNLESMLAAFLEAMRQVGGARPSGL